MAPLRLSPVRLAVLLALTACAPPVDRLPPEEPFVEDGVTYVWSLAHGITGSLSLNWRDGAEVGHPEIILTCEGTARGALQIRDEAARVGPLSLSAAGRTFSVASAPYDRIDQPAYQGEGPFPVDWFDALARAERVNVRYGGRSMDLKGPGPRTVGHLRRYCEKLDRKDG